MRLYKYIHTIDEKTYNGSRKPLNKDFSTCTRASQ